MARVIRKIRGWWDDLDGISITDTLSIVFTILFAVVSIMMFVKLWKDDLTMQSVDFFQVFSYPMLVILSGYFGDKIVGKLNFNRQKQNNEVKNVNQVQQDEMDENYYQEYQVDEEHHNDDNNKPTI